MDSKTVIDTLHLARKYSPKRKFSQSVDFIMNLRGLDLKKPEDNITTFVVLPHGKSKVNRIGALITSDLVSKAKGLFDTIIVKDDFRDYGVNPKKTKNMAQSVDFFVAQADLMTEVAKAFGKVLGPLGKMPNPKAGSVFPATIPDLKPIAQKLKQTVKLQTKNELVIKTSVGQETMSDEQIAENVLAVYNHVFHLLHDDKHKVKTILLKFSMGKPFVIGRTYSPEELNSITSNKEKESKEKKPKQKAEVSK